ncbi:MAG: hypothetical protein H7X94_07700 [Vallitaleaceae bacterium]|nr:hypothetical protein [Vallitaleaceae bacterium]
MDDTHEKPEKDDDIGIPVVPLVLGGMLTTGPILGTGVLPFIGANLFVNEADNKSDEKDEEEDEQRR